MPKGKANRPFLLKHRLIQDLSANLGTAESLHQLPVNEVEARTDHQFDELDQ